MPANRVGGCISPIRFGRRAIYFAGYGDSHFVSGGYCWTAWAEGGGAETSGVIKEQRINLVIANSENIAAGSGITANLFHKVRAYGVDVVTLGDHVYRKADILPTMQASERIVRPANLSQQAVGRTSTVVTSDSGVQVGGFFACSGGFFMNVPSDDPFATADKVLRRWGRGSR